MSYLGGVLENKNAKLLCAGGVRDPIHLYTSLPSTLSLAEVANALKSNSSRWIRQTFPHRRKFAWQSGYGAFSVSKSAGQQLIRYIRNQEVHERTFDFKQEFLSLLQRHQIPYDERYLWD